MSKSLLTIATLCGPEYEMFLSKWKAQLPDWVNVIVYTDDSKGIFEAKNNIVHSCDTEYIWMVDVKGILQKKEYNNILRFLKEPEDNLQSYILFFHCCGFSLTPV